MANKVTSMQILRMIIPMLDRKTFERRISKELNISRNMVKHYREQLHFIDTSTGEEIGCPVLVCVLPFSNLTYVQALPDAKLPNLIAVLNNCLRYFNGAPLSLRTDNMKQVVQKSSR